MKSFLWLWFVILVKRFDGDLPEINKTVKIGRMNDWDIKFNSKGLSRCQCIIE